MQDSKNKIFEIIAIATLFMMISLNSVNAQNASFLMSSVGSFPNASNSISAINFKSNAACLDVQTGIAVLRGVKNDGEFALNCEVSMRFNSLGIKLYPNPVNTFTKIKLQNTPPLTEVFNLSIWTTEGSLVMSRKETGYNLFQGLTVDLTSINAGSYVLKIESAQFVDAIKFIKAN